MQILAVEREIDDGPVDPDAEKWPCGGHVDRHRSIADRRRQRPVGELDEIDEDRPVFGPLGQGDVILQVK
jgi:hypothetical protein